MSDLGRRHRFCDRSSALTYEVTLNVPGAAEAQRLLLWSGDPLASQALAIGPKGLTARTRARCFPCGNRGGIRHGFVVTRPTSIELNETGPPVLLSRKSFTLRVDSTDPTEQSFLYDKDFCFVGEKASLTNGRQLECGVYLLRVSGRETKFERKSFCSMGIGACGARSGVRSAAEAANYIRSTIASYTDNSRIPP